LVVSAVVALGALVAVATTACGSSDPESGFGSSGGASGASGGDPSASGGFGSSGSSGASGGALDSGKVDECKKMDIVFIVDNSGSMSQEQSNLATNFPKFVKVISDYKTKSGDQLDFRVAVSSSDDGKAKGKFSATRAAAAPSGCSAGPARPWLERGDGDIGAMFSCRAQLGTNGSNIERPLENMLLSVTTAVADNSASGASFVREDALLAFVLITDEDEGSAGGSGDLARPMADYPAAFDKVKGDRGRWAASVIAGPNQCSSPGLGNAAEAKRLKGFITDVGKNGVFSSICTGDLTTGLSEALAKFDQACRDFPSGPVK
jgi:hypothetical protein